MAEAFLLRLQQRVFAEKDGADVGLDRTLKAAHFSGGVADAAAQREVLDAALARDPREVARHASQRALDVGKRLRHLTGQAQLPIGDLGESVERIGDAFASLTRLTKHGSAAADAGRAISVQRAA